MKTKEEYLSRLEKFLKELNYKGWDGYGADPISLISYQGAKEVIENCLEEILGCFNLFPGVWGDISFELKDRLLGGILIGDDNFTWFAALDREGTVTNFIGENEPFTPLRCIECLQEIVKFHNLI